MDRLWLLPLVNKLEHLCRFSRCIYELYIPTRNSIQSYLHLFKRKQGIYIHIGLVCDSLPTNSTKDLLALHALTGCNTTPYICGHTKRYTLQVFLKHNKLIVNWEMTPSKDKEADTCVCRIYGIDNADSVDEARRVMFQKGFKPEKLPPTKHALRLHIQCIHYTCTIWELSHCLVPQCPDVTEMGWARDAGLQPIMMTRSVSLSSKI